MGWHGQHDSEANAEPIMPTRWFSISGRLQALRTGGILGFAISDSAIAVGQIDLICVPRLSSSRFGGGGWAGPGK
jgi:hypothetical protein